MMTCEEARRILYDLETSRAEDTSRLDPGSMIALAKAHVSVCMACSEYFDRERSFIATVRDRVGATAGPVPQSLVIRVLEGASQARLQEFGSRPAPPPNGFLSYLRRLFRR